MSDWANYPSAMVDIDTSNTSWLRYASLLKAMGVKNYFWPLVLINPELKGVDPYSKHLTPDQISAIVEECVENPIYFFREVYRIDMAGVPSPVEMNRGVGAMIFLFFSCMDFAMIMQRQRGKSTTADMLRTWVMWLGETGTWTFLYTKSRGLLKKNIVKLKEAVKKLPPYLVPTHKDDPDNTELIHSVVMNTWCLAGVGNKSEEEANKVGRGDTFSITQADEAPHIANVHYGLPTLYRSSVTARENAKRAGKLYCNFITTTAGSLDTEEGAYIYDLIHSGMYWNEKLMDCINRDDLETTVLKNCSKIRPMVNVSLSHYQLGISKEEQIQIVASATVSGIDEVNQDFYGQWTTGSARHPLDRKVLDVIVASEEEPNWVQFFENRYAIRWYYPMEAINDKLLNSPIILSLDSSETVGKDANALIFTDATTMETIGVSTVNESSINQYGLWIADLMVLYPRLLFIPERKSSGSSIVDIVAEKLIASDMNPFKRIFNYVVQNRHENSVAYNEVIDNVKVPSFSLYEKYRKHIGFMPSSDRRKFLYDTVLIQSAESVGHRLKDKVLCSEIKGLVERNGRIDHMVKGHDDHVISWLLAQWFARHGRHLGVYSFDSSRVMSLVSERGAVLTEEELEDRKLLNKLQEEIIALKNRLESCPEGFESGKFEIMLRAKVEEASKYGYTTYTADSIMREVQESKQSKRSLRQGLMKWQAGRSKSPFRY